MLDRVRYPDGDGFSEADLVGFCQVDHAAHAVLRLDNGGYRSISLLKIKRLANPIDAALEVLARPAAAD
jgi:hypothetical protein